VVEVGEEKEGAVLHTAIAILILPSKLLAGLLRRSR
jgi:hypothetical protein